MTIISVPAGVDSAIPERHILHFGPAGDPLLTPWDDKIEAAPLARLSSQVGTAAHALLPAAKAGHEAAMARQLELLDSREQLRKDVAAVHARHEAVLVGLRADMDRAHAAWEKAVEVVTQQEAARRVEAGAIEDEINRINRKLSGLPVIPKAALDDAPPRPAQAPSPARVSPDAKPKGVQLRALRNLCVGPGRHAIAGETFEMELDVANYLIAIGAAQRVREGLLGRLLERGGEPAPVPAQSSPGKHKASANRHA